jgi:hypothetical protein
MSSKDGINLGGRQRSKKISWMPEFVGLNKWGYYMRRRSTGEYKKLGPTTMTRAQVWHAYEALQQIGEFTINDMITQYFASPQFASTAPATQYGYTQNARRLREVFGHMPPDDVTSGDVRRWMDHDSEEKTKANQERALLSICYHWGKERDFCTIENPVTAVKKNKTEPGGRYVDHDDYWAFYDYLIARGHHGHAAAMAISYLCGSRQQDVLALLRNKPRTPKKEDSYLTDDGLVIWQQKTGKLQLKEWNPDLRAAVQLALDHNVRKVKKITQVPSRFVLTGRTGNGFSRGGFNSTWCRRQADALKAGVISQRFRFHDMKIKAASDFDGDDLSRFTGHKTKGMAERYNRTPDKVASLRQPTKRKKD